MCTDGTGASVTDQHVRRDVPQASTGCRDRTGWGGRRNLKGPSKVQHYNSVQKRPNKYSHYLDVIAIGSRSNPTETDRSAEIDRSGEIDKGGHRKSPGKIRDMTSYPSGGFV